MAFGIVFDDPNAIDRLDLDEPDEDRELITGLVDDVLLTMCPWSAPTANALALPERQRTVSRTTTPTQTQRRGERMG